MGISDSDCLMNRKQETRRLHLHETEEGTIALCDACHADFQEGHMISIKEIEVLGMPEHDWICHLCKYRIFYPTQPSKPRPKF